MPSESAVKMVVPDDFPPNPMEPALHLPLSHS